MKRNQFEVSLRRGMLATLAMLGTGNLPMGVALAQSHDDQLPTGDDAASALGDGHSAAPSRSAQVSIPLIELESEVRGTDDARWLEGGGGDFGEARLSSRFGLRRDPMGRGTRMHSGIDLPQPYGEPVRATAPGVVVFAGWRGGYGKMVEIDHGDGVVTRYAHLSRIEVARLEVVSAWQQVGRVGSTGRSTGPHLHYEVRVNDRAVDPLSGRISVAARQVGISSPWVAPEPEPVNLSQTWSEPRRDGSLPQAIINR